MRKALTYLVPPSVPANRRRANRYFPAGKRGQTSARRTAVISLLAISIVLFFVCSLQSNDRFEKPIFWPSSQIVGLLIVPSRPRCKPWSSPVVFFHPHRPSVSYFHYNPVAPTLLRLDHQRSGLILRNL